jgi:hypothetical protein
MLRHEPTLIATTGYQMTASSPRGTFSQAELTAELVIARYITPPMPVPGATIRAMPGDPGRLPALVSPAVPGRGHGGAAGRLPGRVREELPVIAAGEAGAGPGVGRG